MPSSLHIGKYYPPFMGGMEQFLEILVQALASRGSNASVLVHDHRRWTRGEKVSLRSDGGNARLYRAPIIGSLLHAPLSPAFPFWLREALRNQHPDILHFHLPNMSAFWALGLPQARALPWVVHWHADVLTPDSGPGLRAAYPLYRVLERRMLEHADAIVATSPAYLDGSQALRPWRGKTRVIPLGLDPGRLPRPSAEATAWSERQWRDARFRILCIGRLTHYKGHEILLQALEHLPEAGAVLIGEGKLRKRLEKSINGRGLDQRVVLSGEVAPEYLHSALETCDCLCLPSTDRTEAFGLVLLEAMAHAKAAVVSNIPHSGVSWVVAEGETGLTVPPGNPAALADALYSLSRDRGTLALMGEAGRRRLHARFHVDRVREEIADLYDGITGAGFQRQQGC